MKIGFKDSRLAAFKGGGNPNLVSWPLPAPGWHHLAYTFDGTTHRLYIDGTQRATVHHRPRHRRGHQRPPGQQHRRQRTVHRPAGRGPHLRPRAVRGRDRRPGRGQRVTSWLLPASQSRRDQADRFVVQGAAFADVGGAGGDEGVHALAVAQVAALGGQGDVAALLADRGARAPSGSRGRSPGGPARRRRCRPRRRGARSPRPAPRACGSTARTATCRSTAPSAAAATRRARPGGSIAAAGTASPVSRLTRPAGGGEAAVGEQHLRPTAGCAPARGRSRPESMPCGPSLPAIRRAFQSRALPASTSAMSPPSARPAPAGSADRSSPRAAAAPPAAPRPGSGARRRPTRSSSSSSVVVGSTTVASRAVSVRNGSTTTLSSRRADRLGHRLRLRQHRHRVAGGDPQRPDLRVARRQHLGAEQRLADRSGRRRQPPDEPQVERRPPPEVERHPAAGDAQVARDRRQRVQRPHDGPAHLAPRPSPSRPGWRWACPGPGGRPDPRRRPPARRPAGTTRPRVGVPPAPAGRPGGRRTARRRDRPGRDRTAAGPPPWPGQSRRAGRGWMKRSHSPAVRW